MPPPHGDGTVGAGPNPDQHGLAGSWADSATDAQGLLLDVQPGFHGDGVGLVFGGWFTWSSSPSAESAHSWYTIQGEMHADAESSTMPIYLTEGGDFDSPTPTTTVAVGTATLRFGDCTHGSMQYAFDDGRSGTIALTRLLENVRCARDGDAEIGEPSSSYLLSGAWADPSNAGQGLLLELNPEQGVMFGAWYTFARQMPATEGQRWYTLQVALPWDPGAPGSIGIFESHGGRFDAAAETTTSRRRCTTRSTQAPVRDPAARSTSPASGARRQAAASDLQQRRKLDRRCGDAGYRDCISDAGGRWPRAGS
jgi:pseudomonalisin